MSRTTPQPDPPRGELARPRALRAVAPLLAGYLSFGSYWGVWVVILSDFLRRHRISEGEIGIQFAALSVFSIATMTLLSPRLQPLTLSFTIPLALAVMGTGSAFIAYLPTSALMVGFAFLGVGNGLIDVFLNVAAQGIETRMRRPALQWLHASYNLGGVVGAFGAGLATVAGVSFRISLTAPAVLLLLAAAWNLRSASVRALPRAAPTGNKVSLSVFLRSRALLLPAFVVLFAFLVEGSMDIWSVTYLRRTLDASAFVGGIAFAAFSLAMAVGRLFAGRLLFGLGYRRTIQVSGASALAAGIVAALTSSTLVAGVAFLFLGFFIAATTPAAFGLIEGSDEDPALAISAMTTVGYSGFVVGPPIMGWLAQTAGLRATMGLVALATAGVAGGGALAPREHAKPAPAAAANPS